MNNNLLIGAISGNYSINDIDRWVVTSEWEGVDRALLIYNSHQNPQLIQYLKNKNISVITPNFDFFGNPLKETYTNTGTVNLTNSYNLVHNLRFFHISQYLSNVNYKKVFTTDVKDVYFNKTPFIQTPTNGLIVTGEVIKYFEDDWNGKHLITNLGLYGYELWEEEVLNVGVFGGGKNNVESICRDIYLMSCGKPLVADQTSFNYLIRNNYKNQSTLTSINDNFAVHLHVVANGKVNLDLNTLDNYSIIHQYDRL